MGLFVLYFYGKLRLIVYGDNCYVLLLIYVLVCCMLYVKYRNILTFVFTYYFFLILRVWPGKNQLLSEKDNDKTELRKELTRQLIHRASPVRKNLTKQHVRLRHYRCVHVKNVFVFIVLIRLMQHNRCIIVVDVDILLPT